MHLSRFNIATRLGLGFGMLLVLLVAIATLGLVQMSHIQQRLDEITKINNVELSLVVTMRSAISQRATAIRNVLLLNTPEEKLPEYEKRGQALKVYEEAEAKLGAMFTSLPETTAEEKEWFAKIKEIKARSVPLADKAAELGMANKRDEATQVLMKEVRPIQKEWLDLLAKLADKEESLNAQAAAESEKAYNQARWLAITLSLIAVALGGAIALLISRSVTRPVNEAVAIATRVAGGDLTGRIEVKSTDEVGQLMQALKDMNDSLATLIREARQSSDEVSTAAGALAASASQVATSSSQQSEAASSMAAAVEEMTVSIGQITEHAHDAHGLSVDSSAQSEDGGKIIHATISEMEKIAASVTESARIVQDLSKHSAQITGIVQVIKDVAEQTNLLALNAAIEAARAGEQGRGFAVVADEVRKLAERTSQSTVEISGMIGKIQEGINRVTDSMNAGVGLVSQGMAQANEAGEAIGRITQHSRGLTGTINDIGGALKEQSSATNEIARSVERVAQMAEENHAAVGETAKTADRLETLAATLQNTVNRFRT